MCTPLADLSNVPPTNPELILLVDGSASRSQDMWKNHLDLLCAQLLLLFLVYLLHPTSLRRRQSSSADGSFADWQLADL